MKTMNLKCFSCSGLIILILAAGCTSFAKKSLSEREFGGVAPAMVSPLPPIPDATAAQKPIEAPQHDARLMVYNATVNLVVPDVAGALDKLTAMAVNLKGYMQEMTGNSITLRIPAVRFNEAIQSVAGMGEVTKQQIKGADVTEEMLDFQIRLKNMEQVRERLLKLIEKGDKVEDLLKVSQELERVTENIELLKGKIQYLQSQISYSTMRVELNSSLPKKEQVEAFPFQWVRRLGTEISSSQRSFEAGRRMSSWLKFELPASYVKLEEYNNVTRAMSGEGVLLLVKRERNFQGGTLEFWSQIVRRWLTSNSVVAITEQKDVTLDTRAKGTLFVGTKTYGRKTYTYWLAVVVRKDFVYTFECWGADEHLQKDRAALEKALKSMRISP